VFVILKMFTLQSFKCFNLLSVTITVQMFPFINFVNLRYIITDTLRMKYKQR